MRFFALMCWVLLLSWLTHFAASPTWRTPVITERLLIEADAANPLGWQSSGPASKISVSNEGVIGVQRDINKRGRISRHIALPINASLLRLQATLQTDTSAADRLTWHPAPVLLLKDPTRSNKYLLVERPMFFQSLVTLDEVIELEQPNTSIEVLFSSPPQTDWQLSNLTLSSVDEDARYRVSQYLLAGLWLITLCIGIYRAWRRARMPTVVVVGILGPLLGAVLASSDAVSAFFTIFKRSLNHLGGGITSGQFSSLMQNGHVILFAVLTLAVLIFHKHWGLLHRQVLVGLGVLAVATEALQRHAVGRSPDVQDFLFDVFGVLLGFLIFAVFKGLFKASKRLLSEPS